MNFLLRRLLSSLAIFVQPPPGFGGGGRPGGSKGGSSGTPAVQAAPFGENGGFYATSQYLFMAIQPSNGGSCYISIFNPSNYNDTTDGSTYSFRQEDVIVGRVPTVRRVILVYRDLGPATLTVTLTGTNDNNQVVTISSTVALGTPSASYALLTQFVDITLTAYRPQLSLNRAAGAGPISIVSATLIGTVEDVSL